jgi:hypothetical protein
MHLFNNIKAKKRKWRKEYRMLGKSELITFAQLMMTVVSLVLLEND